MWTFAGGPSFAANASHERISEEARAHARQSMPRGFDDVVSELSTALKSVETGDDDAFDKAMELRAEIRDRDTALQQEFADVEAMIKDKGLPDEILQRHRDFVAQYKERLATVESSLSRVEQGAVAPDGFFERAWFNTKIFFSGDPVREEAAAATAELLNSFQPKRIQKSFKPEDLPFRRLTPQKDLKPKETAEEWRRALDPAAQTSAIGKALGAIGDTIIPQAMAQSSDPPGPEDLAETIEVQFTPEIVALAAQLNNSPLEIYNWVLTNIQTNPVWGSVQGADYCRQTKNCNAFDTASLLIALLRTSGIPARYQLGTIELGEPQARNWLGGFDSLQAAGQFAAAAGTPATLHTKLDGLQTMRLDHVWVKAFLNYLPSQGDRPQAGTIGVDIDASFKEYEYKEPVPLEDLSLVDIEQLSETLIQSATFDPVTGALTSYDLDQVSAALAGLGADIEQSLANLPEGATLADIRGQEIISQPRIALIPSTLPYVVIARGPGPAEVPDTLRHTLRISFGEGSGFFDTTEFSYAAPLAKLAGSRISLEFEGASPVDRAAASVFLESLDLDGTALPIELPVSLLNLVAHLKIDGNSVATSLVAPMGASRNLTLAFSAPGGATSPVVNEVTVGEYIAIGLNVAGIAPEQIENRANASKAIETEYDEAVADPNQPVIFDEDIRAIPFASVIDTWFVNVDLIKDVSYRAAGAAWVRYPSVGAFFSDLAPLPLFGTPWKVRSTGLVMDIDRNLSVSESRISNDQALIDATLMQGLAGSSLESLVPVAVLDIDLQYFSSFATTDVLNHSIRAGIPILQLTQENFSDLQSELVIDEGSFQDIADAVAAGNIVIVPAEPIPIAGRAISGFAVIDPSTGGGDYIVGQSISGGIIFIIESRNAQLKQLEFIESTATATFGILLGVAEDLGPAEYFSKAFGPLTKIFGHVFNVLNALKDISNIYYDPKASDVQKALAITVIVSLLLAVTALAIAFSLAAAAAAPTGIGLVLAGPLASLVIGTISGLVVDFIKDYALKTICSQCDFK